jgi:hypothetical protein
MKIIGIDPGNISSGYIVTDDLVPVEFGNVLNKELIHKIKKGRFDDCHYVLIEMINSMGKPVGKSVFDTCVAIGEFKAYFNDERVELITRNKVKHSLVGRVVGVNDSVIRKACIKEYMKVFGLKSKKEVIGSKNDKGMLYGVTSHVWQALGLTLAYKVIIDEAR